MDEGRGPLAGARRTATRRTVLLLLVLAGTSTLLAGPALDVGQVAGASPRLPAWVMALAFGVTELLVVHIQIQREGHAFTFSEVPLVVGLFLAGPAALLTGRIVGEVATLTLRERQGPVKLAFNAALFAAETSLALVVFGAARGGARVDDLQAWAAALVAVAAADLVGGTAVALVIGWHGGESPLGQVTVLGTLSALANTSLGIAAVLLLSTNVAAVTLLFVIAAVLFVAYRGYTSLIERHESLELLYEFTRAVGVSPDAGEVLQLVLERTRELLRAESAMITLLDGAGTVPVLRVCSRDGTVTQTTGPIDGNDPLWSLESARAGNAIVRIPREPKEPMSASELGRLGVKDLMTAPLRGKDSTIGFVTVADRLGDLETFRPADARLFETVANHAAVVLENGRLIDALRREVSDREYQALHDHLTGLPNRPNFLGQLNAAMKDGGRLAVMLIDLDHFKDVNDTLGHQYGDTLLVAVADRLRATMRERAIVARLGGDEFAVLAVDHTEESAVRFARFIRATLAEPFAVEDVSIDAGGSVGVALWPDHAEDVPSLLKHADVAMYAAKTTDQGVQLYEPEADRHSLRRLTLSAALRQALANDELMVHYQPKARLRDGVVIGAEALVRWNHPEYGPVSPEEFIPIAERAALVGALTRVVLRAALHDRNRWAASGHDYAVSVNLSPRSLFDIGFPTELEALLAETRTPGDRLTFEITESCIMDPTRSEAFLGRIAATGVHLSVDDFGTGFSSLSYLHRLPVHEVKIDKSFVLEMSSGETDGSIVRSVVDLGHNLGLTVVAEGVEDHLAWNRLNAIGCDIAQGYLLSRPLPSTEFLAWASDHRQTNASTQPVRTADRLSDSLPAARA